MEVRLAVRPLAQAERWRRGAALPRTAPIITIRTRGMERRAAVPDRRVTGSDVAAHGGTGTPGPARTAQAKHWDRRGTPCQARPAYQAHEPATAHECLLPAH